MPTGAPPRSGIRASLAAPPAVRPSGRMTARSMRVADCVRLPDGRIGRVRAVSGGAVRVRVRRKGSPSRQFLQLPARKLRRIDCPDGWMSPQGYARYLRVTLAKMRKRQAAVRKATRTGAC
jgi:hypothetical protein